MSIVDSNVNISCSKCGSKPDKCHHSRIRKSILDECNDLSREFENIVKTIIKNIDDEVSK